MPQSPFYPYVLMHFVALLWGSAGLWGKLVSLSVGQTVSGRTALAAVALAIIAATQGQLTARKNWQGIRWLIASALLLGGHWYCFFYTIKFGSVALGLVTFAATPIFVALVEPLISGTRYRALPLFCAVLSLLGIWCVHPVYVITSFEELQVMLVGIFGSLLLAGCTLVTRYRLSEMHPAFLCCGVSFIIALLSFPFAPIVLSDLTPLNIAGLIGLGLLCTALGQMLFVVGMRHVAAGTASIIASLEAPYGMILAAIFIGEPLTVPIITGLLLVCSAVFLVTRSELSSTGARGSRLAA